MKCSLLLDQGENDGNCKKTGRKKGRTSEESCASEESGSEKGASEEGGGEKGASEESGGEKGAC